jgi:type VI secretion system ImpA family protein
MTGAPAAAGLEELLAPIAGAGPAGEALRYEGTYDAIREARREDDPTLPQGVWKRELKRADWKEVVRLATGALGRRSKDLQLGAWLVEAWIRVDGLPGAARGFRLLAGLCDRFWADLHPPIEDGDLEGRLAPLEWLNREVVTEVKRLALTDGAGSEGREWTWLDWEGALHGGQPAAGGKAESGEPAAGPPTRATILARVSVTRTPFYRRWAEDLAAAAAALEELAAVLDAKCGAQAPSLGRFRETFGEMSNFVGRVIDARREEAMDVDEGGVDEVEPAGEGERPAAGGAAASRTSGGIGSRAEAYRMLAQAADYLLRTEPHSPAPYLVRRAIAWGSMSLAEVLKELLQQKADLTTVYQLLGIGPGEA